MGREFSTSLILDKEFSAVALIQGLAAAAARERHGRLAARAADDVGRAFHLLSSQQDRGRGVEEEELQRHLQAFGQGCAARMTGRGLAAASCGPGTENRLRNTVTPSWSPPVATLIH